jgi:hypothetical protein
MTAWLPGDLLLFRERTPSGPSDAITRVQSLDFAANDARWTHVAMYAGEGELIDATLEKPHRGDGDGIRRRAVSEYIPHGHVRVRRDPTLTTAQRDDLVEYAAGLCGREYSIPRAVQLFGQFVQSRAPWLVPLVDDLTDVRLANETMGYVCSDVYTVSYEFITDKTIATVEKIPSPALLSASPVFIDIEVTWCEIPSRPRVPIVDVVPASPGVAARMRANLSHLWWTLWSFWRHR